MTSIEYDFEFLAGVHVNGALHFNSYLYTIKMYPATDVDYDHNVAFDRIKYLIEGIVSMSVFVFEDDTDAIMKLVTADIPVLTIPYPGPVDQMLQFVLAAKINAMIEGTFVITDTTISSDMGNDVKYTYSYSDDDDEVETLIDDSITKWWNAPEPRFVTVFTEKEANDFEPTQSWEDLDMLWFEDAVDEEGELVFEPEEEGEEATAEPNSNIIHLNMPKKKDEN